MKWLLQHARVQAMLIRVFAWYLDMALRTRRWTVDGAEHLAPHRAGAPAIVAFWHETLPLMPALVRRSGQMEDYRSPPIHFLVSRHRDGRLIGAMMRRFGPEPVFGSSSRGGAAAMLGMIRLLRGGAIIGITPDGPRGPARIAAPGIAQLAAVAGVPVIACGGAITGGRRLGTWDRMILPLPFGRGVLTCRPAIRVERDAWQQAVPLIAEELNRAMAQAEQLCGTRP
jgi:lysophospholipid acyltransferase (LPLAT)-like uncharacterized protein